MWECHSKHSYAHVGYLKGPRPLQFGDIPRMDLGWTILALKVIYCFLEPEVDPLRIFRIAGYGWFVGPLGECNL